MPLISGGKLRHPEPPTPIAGLPDVGSGEAQHARPDDGVMRHASPPPGGAIPTAGADTGQMMGLPPAAPLKKGKRR